MEDEKDVLEQEEVLPAHEEEIEDAPEAEDESEAEDGAEPTEDADRNAEEDAQELDLDALEYDADGNIIIPEEIEEEETSEDGAEPPDEGAEPPAEDERDVELRDLRARLADLEAQGRDTLRRLGVDAEDVMKGLARVAAESADLPQEEYDAQRQAARVAEREAEAKRVADFEELAARDLAELQSFYPETKSYKHVRDMPAAVLQKFAANRNLGLTAKEAYAAANPEGIRSSAASIAKKQAMNESKAHLRPSVPKKGSSHESIRMTRAEYKMWKELFPDKNDKEIVALYRKTKD